MRSRRYPWNVEDLRSDIGVRRAHAVWALIAAGACLGACTVIDRDVAPAPDWPRLEVRIHRVKGGELIAQCWRAESLFMKLNGALPGACAWVNFGERTCDVYIPGYAKHLGYVLNHELEHCRGYDHYGDDTMHAAWAHWKEQHAKDRHGLRAR